MPVLLNYVNLYRRRLLKKADVFGALSSDSKDISILP